jgi:periplasmic protein TonB
MVGIPMTAAFAPALPSGPTLSAAGAALPRGGTQNLLSLRPGRQFYLAEAAAIAIYALILSAGLNYTTKPQEAPEEQPMELVMEAPPPPVEEVKPPEAVEPPPPVIDEPPPPPIAETPAVAPVEPPPPPKPKPIHKDPPKPKPVVQQRPAAAVGKPQQYPAAAAPAKPVPVGATASAIANQIHGCLARAGASLYPESQKPRSAHVAYRANISPTGAVSYSWSSSGNPAFDSAAQRAAGRCGHVEAPGRPAALSGAINFAYR